ncbi:hypothetical protein ScPMuIL_013997 [Solemya velum]
METPNSSDSEFNDENTEDISYNELFAIPHFLGPRAHLVKSLDLGHNIFTCLPNSISQFRNLVTLDFSNNDVLSVDDGIVKLQHLRSFVAKNNKLDSDSFPKNFGLLKNLEVLNLSGNSLGEVPIQFTELEQLRGVYLGGNKISSLPGQVSEVRLEVLYLGGNCLTEIPAELGALVSLISLTLCDNQLQSIPPTLSHLQRLQSLSLHNNQLSTLPPDIISLNLIELSLRNNPLVVQFVQEFVYEPPTLLELAGRIIKLENIPYSTGDAPSQLVAYLDAAHSCVNPKCRAMCVYFSSRVEHVKFVDFCGKYRVPLLSYLCSPKCRNTPVSLRRSESDSDDEDLARDRMRRVLLG